MPVTYSNSIFINCPFDEEYSEISNAIIFTILDCGFNPRCVLEIDDGTQNRLDKIITLIRECRLSIHDLSRTQLDLKYSLPRFNMPFELGLFFGAKYYGVRTQKDKSCLILECKSYEYQKFLSDIAGHDVKAHKNDTKVAIKLVSEWLQLHTENKGLLPDVKMILSRYAKFEQAKPDLCKELNLSFINLLFTRYCFVVNRWIQNTKLITEDKP